MHSQNWFAWFVHDSEVWSGSRRVWLLSWVTICSSHKAITCTRVVWTTLWWFCVLFGLDISALSRLRKDLPIHASPDQQESILLLIAQCYRDNVQTKRRISLLTTSCTAEACEKTCIITTALFAVIFTSRSLMLSRLVCNSICHNH